MNELIALADLLDRQGRVELADELDSIIKAFAEARIVSLKELESLTGRDMTETLKEMIEFELTVEPIQGGEGNTVKARPKMHDKWTDGLVLGDITNYPALRKYWNL